MTQWESKIIGHRRIDPAELVANPENFRKHGADQSSGLAGVINEIGFIDSVTVNQRADGTLMLIDGHLRVAQAIATGQELIDIELVQLDPEAERLALLTKDRLAAMAQLDAQMMADLYGAVADDPHNDQVSALLDSIADDPLISELLTGIMAEASPIPDDADDIEPVAATRCQPGDLWLIGAEPHQHRLIIGDALDPAVQDRLLAGQRPDMVLSDPPYGMALDTDYAKMEDWGARQTDEKHVRFKKKHAGAKSKTHAPVIGDDQPFDIDQFLALYGQAAEVFLFGADYYSAGFPDSLSATGAMLVWDKRSNEGDSAESGFDDMFGSTFELIWSKQRHKRDIIRHRWVGYYGTESEDTRARVHPTQKPVGVLAWLIERYGPRAPLGLIVDPYMGSGSALIAAQRAGHRCYGMEISPFYGDVILGRAEAAGLAVVKG